MTPVFPFFAIFAGLGVQQIYQVLKNFIIKYQKSNNIFSFSFFILHFAFLILVILPGIAFMSIYTHEDSRVTASRWIYENVPSNSYILSETANVVDIPLQIPNYTLPSRDYNLTVISFDFYHLDEEPRLFLQLLNHLEKADYILIPSRRIFANHPRQANKYPLVTKYYQLLFSGRLGFEKVTEISSFPGFTLYPLRLTLPDEEAEETFTVFDHPVVRIYRKTKSLNIEEYKKLFKNQEQSLL
jgi:hypothetical protein